VSAVDLRYSESDEKFRAELRAWLEKEVADYGPAPVDPSWEERRRYDTGWQKRLFDGGYAGINWPKEYGGADLSLSEQLVYYEETARARAPYVGVNFVGLLHGGPTLIAEGTPEQKAKHVAPILRGEQVWCQGFSERARAATSHRCRRAPCAMATTISSAATRYGPRSRKSPTTASCSCAPTRIRRSTRASAG